MRFKIPASGPPIAGLLLLLTAALPARPAPGNPQVVRQAVPAIDSARLAAVLDSLRRAVGAPGASAAVIFPDGGVWSGASGDAWHGVAATPRTVFDVGSITKPYTAALVLYLASEGKLRLEDSVVRWLPDFPAPGVTIRHLLQHTSGIPDYASNPAFIPAIRARMAGPWSPEENLPFAGSTRTPPDSAWRYSNTNYVLLGIIAGKAGGGMYSQLLRRFVLDPLSLRETFVAGEDSISAARAHAFVDFTGDGKADDLSAVVPDPATTRGAGGAGAIVATAQDVARFARAYFTGTFLGEAMHREVVRWRDRGDGWRYGLGVIGNPRGPDLLLGHLGNTTGVSAGVWHSRETEITAVLLANMHGVRMAAPALALLDAAVAVKR